MGVMGRTCHEHLRVGTFYSFYRWDASDFLFVATLRMHPEFRDWGKVVAATIHKFPTRLHINICAAGGVCMHRQPKLLLVLF